MLRESHDLTAGHPLAGGRECVLHGDPGPFNTIFSGGTPVAFVDWTSSRPGGRLDDLGHMAWTWCIQSEGNVPLGAQAAHLRELRDAYGPVPPQALIDAMIPRPGPDTAALGTGNPGRAVPGRPACPGQGSGPVGPRGPAPHPRQRAGSWPHSGEGPLGYPGRWPAGHAVSGPRRPLEAGGSAL